MINELNYLKYSWRLNYSIAFVLFDILWLILVFILNVFSKEQFLIKVYLNVIPLFFFVFQWIFLFRSVAKMKMNNSYYDSPSFNKLLKIEKYSDALLYLNLNRLLVAFLPPLTGYLFYEFGKQYILNQLASINSAVLIMLFLFFLMRFGPVGGNGLMHNSKTKLDNFIKQHLENNEPT